MPSMSTMLESSAFCYLFSNYIQMRAALDETAKVPVLSTWLFPSLRAWAGGRAKPAATLQGGRAPGPFAGHSWPWRGTQRAAPLVSQHGAALPKLLGFGSNMLFHSLPCFSDIGLQCSNGQHNV